MKKIFYLLVLIPVCAFCQNAHSQAVSFRTGYVHSDDLMGSTFALQYSLPLVSHLDLALTNMVDLLNADNTVANTTYQSFDNSILVGVAAHCSFAQRCMLRATAQVGMDLFTARHVAPSDYTCAADWTFAGTLDFNVHITDRSRLGLFAGIGHTPKAVANGDSTLRMRFGLLMDIGL